MGVGPAIFQSAGQRTEHYVPGAYSRSQAVGGSGGGFSANNGVILGRSKGGPPHRLFTFATVDEARETLVDGELLRAVAHAFNPSPDYAPQAIRAMTVNENTQGEATLRARGNEVLHLKTASYGTVANGITRRIDHGSKPGTRKIIFTAGEIEETIDTIGKQSLQLQYIGTGTAAILDVNNIGLSVEVTKVTGRPYLDVEGLEQLRVSEGREFTLSTTNPESAAIKVAAKIDIRGVDTALLKFEFLDLSLGIPEWKIFDVNELFKGPDPQGFPLTETISFKITPLLGSEGHIMDYKITLLEMATDGPTTNVIAETTRGQIAIAALNEPYDLHVIPAYDIHSGSVFLSFEDYPTIEELVKRLNVIGDFIAIALEEEANIPSAELDAVGSVDILNDPLILTSDYYALFHALERSLWIGKGNVSKVEGAPNWFPDNDEDPVYFDGAGAGTYTVSDWNRALVALETENIQIISTPVTDHAVHALIANHCAAMSNVHNRKERTALLGGPIGETIDEAIVHASSLNTSLVSYCFPAIRAMSPLTGSAEELPASYLACKLLGMECAVTVNEPLTWKNVSVLQFLVKLTTTDLNKLIIGGVLCGGLADETRLAVIRAMTTHQGNQLQLVERSMVREDLYMNRDIRLRYGSGIGRPGTSTEADARQTLIDAAKDWKGAGLIVPTNRGENIWGVRVVKKGDATLISFNRNLTPPQNFFFVTAYNYVYESATEVEL